MLLAAALLVMLVFCWRMQVALAAPAPPAGCVPHTTFVPGGTDYVDDYRCAGTAIDYHTGGVGRSPYPIWAGQWLLVDESGNFRLGWCTFNRGTHPTIDRHSAPITQSLPNDPRGAKSAYLMWRYGRTSDNTRATALWAVFHYYAQDAAGSNRASNASAPLVPSLQGISEASGRQDVEGLAIALDAEASRLAGPFSIDVVLASNGSGSARVLAGGVPVPATAVRVEVQGAAFDDESQTADLVTDDTGSVAFEIVGPAQSATVVASTSAPGSAQVYRAAAADPVGHLPQTLITTGTPAAVQGQAGVTLDDLPTTTTEAPPTTEVPTTEAPPTTDMPPSTEETTTVPETTTTEVATTTTVEATTTRRSSRRRPSRCRRPPRHRRSCRRTPSSRPPSRSRPRFLTRPSQRRPPRSQPSSSSSHRIRRHRPRNPTRNQTQPSSRRCRTRGPRARRHTSARR
ncbi:MAG: hypothetical protein JWN62_2820 [Acidimicrobiales bacterium]|nr:hypothetical protein [Acidimicrobiales bacterium]